MSVASPTSGQIPRFMEDTFDANLEILDSDDTSITTITADGENRAAPDMVSNVINLGNGIVKGVLVLKGVVLDVADNDELAEIAVMGSNAAGSNVEQLAAKLLGALEITGNTQDQTGGVVFVPFINVGQVSGVLTIYPKVYMRITNYGTVGGLAIAKAYIVPLD